MDKLLNGGSFGTGVPIKAGSHRVSNSDLENQRQTFFPAASGGGLEHSDNKISFLDDDDDSEEVKSQYYTIVKKITNGMYGEVFEGISKKIFAEDGQPRKVAVKKVSMHGKYYRQHAEREIKALRKISHTNVIKLLFTIEEADYSVLLFALCETDLYVMQQNNVIFDLEEVRSIALMTFSGLKAVHDLGIMHRDMKLSNLLMSKEGVIKICDFGLARGDDDCSPFTLQISTKWYKALEVLLGEKKYNRKVDIWAMGAILSELVSGKVLFNGNCDLHVLSEIFQVMGSEHFQTPVWVERTTYPQYGHFIWSEIKPANLSDLLGTTDSMFLNLVKQMLTFSVAARPSVDDCLAHEWLKNASQINSSLQAKAREKYDISSCY